MTELEEAIKYHDGIRKLRMEQKRSLDIIGVTILIWMAANAVIVVLAFMGKI